MSTKKAALGRFDGMKSQRSEEQVEKSAKKLCIGGADRGTSLRSALKSQTGKPIRNVTMGPREVIDLDEAEYWQLRICVDCHIVVSFQAVNLCSIEAEGDAVMLQKCGKKGPYYLVTQCEKENFEILQTGQSLFDNNRELQKELTFLWTLIESLDIPVRQDQCLCPLQQFEILLFLHMLSILVDSDVLAFAVSAKFLGIVGQHFRKELGIDIMELVARFVYLIWLSPSMSHADWNRFPGVLFPRGNLKVVTWWNNLQPHVRVNSDQSFCEEYWCITTCPRVEGMSLRTAFDAESISLQDELKGIKYKFLNGAIRVVPAIPDSFFCQYHDAAVSAEPAVAYPRVLSPVRPSGPEVLTTWGNDDGNPLKINEKNVIVDYHCFLKVEHACLPAALTLGQLLGSLKQKLVAAFVNAVLPVPRWFPRSWMPRNLTLPPPVEGQSLCYYNCVQYQILGSLVMSSLRPDNVFHPHLRCHVEYHVGRLLACEIVGDRLDTTKVLEFMYGCGIGFGVGKGWIQESLDKRFAADITLHALHAHTQWGEKCRVYRYLKQDPPDDSLWFVAVACPNQEKPSEWCLNHCSLVGCGTLCNMYHGLTVRHAKQLMWNVLHYLECASSRSRGVTQTSQSLGHIDTLLGEMGYKCPVNVQYHVNEHRRLQLFHLPRALPRFHSDEKIRQSGDDMVWVGWGLCEKKNFESVEVDTLIHYSMVTRRCAHEVEEFFLELRKYCHVRPDDECRG